MENQTRQLTKLEKFMNTPENRIKYAFIFYDENCGDDYQMRELALSRAMNWIAVCEDEEAHY